MIISPILLNGCGYDDSEGLRGTSHTDVTSGRETVEEVGPVPVASAHTTAPQSDTTAPSRRPEWEAQLSPEDAARDSQLPPTTLRVPQRTFHREGKQRALRVGFDDFDLQRVLGVTFPPPGIEEQFPQWLSDLHGQRIRVRGYMVPGFREEELSRFVLARDTEVCCFGPQGKIYHLVSVALRGGEYTDYIHLRPFDVEGVFAIVPIVEGDELLQLYQLDDAVMIER